MPTKLTAAEIKPQTPANHNKKKRGWNNFSHQYTDALRANTIVMLATQLWPPLLEGTCCR